MAGPSISAVIPALNEEGRIGAVVRGCLPYVDEVVVVDDGSADGTAREAEAAGARVFRNDANLGYIGSVKRGFREARGEILVTLDADGEHRVGDIPALVVPIMEGNADLVFGMRAHVPRPSERLINRIVRGRAGGLADTGTGFRAVRRELALRLELRGRCTCGVLVLEAVALGGRPAGVPSETRSVRKPRRVAWGHLPQLLRVAWLLLRS